MPDGSESTNMATLREQLADLANTAPVIADPEDDVNTETRAQVENYVEEAGEEVGRSELRRNVAPLLEDIDTRYSGRKISRKTLLEGSTAFDESGGSSEEDEDSCVSSDDGDCEDIADFRKKFSSSDNKSHSIEQKDTGYLQSASDAEQEQVKDDESDISEEESVSASDNEESDDEQICEDIESQASDVDVVQKFSQIDVHEDIEKGKATKAQLAIWDSLLDCRIKMQKLLVLVNKLPQFDVFEDFRTLGDQDYRDALKKGQKDVKLLLDTLTHLQETLLQANPETQHVIQLDSSLRNKTDSNEEITSESEEDIKKTSLPVKRKLNGGEYSEFLAKRHKSFTNFRNATIHKWNEKTKLVTGKASRKNFSAFEQSALKQIEQILMDKERLIKRTQLKRSVYKVLGKPEVEVSKEVEVSEQENLPKQEEHLKEYDSEIYDDDDFYHQLLRELIERKTVDVNDPIALSRHWLEIQKLRSKIKRKVDTKASKGRKVRYDVHPKLVNFMAPLDNSLMTDEARNELYSSLFGKKSYHISSL
ncbi:protein AATF-like isoform X2 [Tachypleus tridentatus]|uniref:protein AATF-like isoform X2 n=1 Tax=Tachypleus tridentatus TaxID=6853 RepID=UPI003FD1BA8B